MDTVRTRDGQKHLYFMVITIVVIFVWGCNNDKKTKISSIILNNDGRPNQALVEGTNFKEGKYELVFFVGDYFKKITDTPKVPFLDDIIIKFGISNVEEHYHVPLLVSPWSYSTYRGS